jgi:hypothetical protein
MADAEDRGHGRAAVLFGLLATGLVQVAPAVALLHDGLQILAPHRGVLDGVADDRAGQPRRDVLRLELAVTKVGGQRQALVDDRDRLGSRQRRRGDLELVLAVLGLPRAELAEDRDDPADLLEGGRLGRRSRARPISATRCCTISTSCSTDAGKGARPC